MGKGTPQNSLQGNQARSVQHVITASTYQRKTPAPSQHTITTWSSSLSLFNTCSDHSSASGYDHPFAEPIITILCWNYYYHSHAESITVVHLVNPLITTTPCWIHIITLVLNPLQPPFCWIHYHHRLAESITTTTLLSLLPPSLAESITTLIPLAESSTTTSS